MSKDDVLLILETRMTDPGADKSYEYLEEHVLRDVKRIVLTDRIGLIEALREWLGSGAESPESYQIGLDELREWLMRRTEPEPFPLVPSDRTMLAVRVIQELRLKELKPEIEKVRNDIITGKICETRSVDLYLPSVNKALSALEE